MITRIIQKIKFLLFVNFFLEFFRGHRSCQFDVVKKGSFRFILCPFVAFFICRSCEKLYKLFYDFLTSVYLLFTFHKILHTLPFSFLNCQLYREGNWFVDFAAMQLITFNLTLTFSYIIERLGRHCEIHIHNMNVAKHHTKHYSINYQKLKAK